jgi:hypothetical protein
MKRVTFDRKDSCPMPELKTEGEGLKVAEIEYGYQVMTEEYSEWAITIIFVTRQDGKTAWSVSLVQVDGDINVRNGLTTSGPTTYEYIESEIADLTGGWLPKYRINSIDEEDD